ncbi:MAG: Aldo/keto reductase [Proteobacteria bacterium]|nr:Aldo/keto reductase [Pseudomonadota bacterium]
MKTVLLPSGERVSAMGQGTWFMGEDASSRAEEIASLREGIELGLALIDTAEMYGEGESEKLVGQAIAGWRDQVFLVSKVYPHNATRKGTLAACERSLRRLGTDYLDLYLLHWRGSVPFAETLEALVELRAMGKIRHFGVSNLDLEDMQEFCAETAGNQVATNQLLYNLTRRGIEWDLLPWCRQQRIPIMAYSPIEQARLLRHPKLVALAQRHGLTAAQVALGWLLANDDIIAIPKSGKRSHVRENAAVLARPLSAEILAELDQIFPPPQSSRPLEML